MADEGNSKDNILDAVKREIKQQQQIMLDAKEQGRNEI